MQADETRKQVLRCTDCNGTIVVRITDVIVRCSVCHSGRMLPVAQLEQVAPKDVLGMCKSISTYLKGPATYNHSDSVLSEVYARLVELNETLKATHWRAVAEAEAEAKVQLGRRFQLSHSGELVKLCTIRQIAKDLGKDDMVEYLTREIEGRQKERANK